MSMAYNRRGERRHAVVQIDMHVQIDVCNSSSTSLRLCVCVSLPARLQTVILPALPYLTVHYRFVTTRQVDAHFPLHPELIYIFTSQCVTVMHAFSAIMRATIALNQCSRYYIYVESIHFCLNGAVNRLQNHRQRSSIVESTLTSCSNVVWNIILNEVDIDGHIQEFYNLLQALHLENNF